MLFFYVKTSLALAVKTHLEVDPKRVVIRSFFGRQAPERGGLKSSRGETNIL